jgi:IS1 family transposase
MNQLSAEDRSRIVACLVEGTSQRATCRITGHSRKGVARLAVELGEACERFADRVFRDLQCEQIQCDEIWSFVGSKEKNTTAAKKREGCGDAWTFVAIDPATKLIPGWYVGDRSAESAYRFLRDLSPRLAKRVQLSTDGHKAYLIAVEAAWAFRTVDYGMLTKIYGNKTESGKYSPGEVVGTVKETVMGMPDEALICTSHVERQNLTMRMQMRRFTRLTNAFSKKLESHRAACAVHFIHYNFCRIHQTLRVTPAMEAGLTDHVWSLAEIVGLLAADAAQSLAA